MAWIFSAALVQACERSPCSPAPAAASSPASSAGTEPCAPSSATPMPQAFSSDSKTLATYRRSRYGMTCAPLTADRGEALLTAFLAGSPARTSAPPVPVTAWTVNAPDSGASLRGWFVRWSPPTSEWKTAQCSLLGDSESFSGTWPRSGSMLDGTCFQRPTLAPRIYVSAFGSLLPTLCAVDTGAFFNQSKSEGAALRPTLGAMAKHNLWPTLTVHGNNNQPKPGTKRGYGLASAVRLPTLTTRDRSKRGEQSTQAGGGPTLRQALRMPTLAARDYRHPNKATYSERGGGAKGEQLPNTVGGPLNPDWCEWFMGWPIGWTASSALATDRYREWLRQHGCCWRRN